MPTIGLLFILGGLMLGRQVITGRVMETPEDIRDITLSLLSGDFATTKEVLSRRGENVSPDVSSVVAAGTSGEAALTDLLVNPLTGGLLAKAVELGSAAKGYRRGATGPDWYDCSGLVWQAMRSLDLYSGPRFTTANFVKALGSNVKSVNKPVVGDIVLWPGRHMGIVSGTDQMYSAMSPAKGIGYSVIKGAGLGPAVYYRLSATAVPEAMK